jgi:hypothetical protein
MYAINTQYDSFKTDNAHQPLHVRPEKSGRTVVSLVSDRDTGGQQRPEEAQFNPEKYLVDRVLSAYQLAKEKNRAVCLKHDFGSITLFPGDHRVLVWMPEQYLSSLAASPVDDESLSVSELTMGPSSGLNPLDPQYDLDALLWKLTLIASRGRFPAGTDLHAPVVLKSWPDLSRLQSVPYASRIADMWHRNPRSLLATANVLDIPPRYVFSFYSAAHMMGLADTVQRKDH